jgi:hypothetical protein
LLWANAHRLNSRKSETAENLRSMRFFLSALDGTFDSKKRPTGG